MPGSGEGRHIHPGAHSPTFGSYSEFDIPQQSVLGASATSDPLAVGTMENQVPFSNCFDPSERPFLIVD
jgi:hypothetical protein